MLRLIIVDDEKIIRETISHLIDWNALGIQLIGTCKDGLEAYEMILDEYPDIVLTDIKMPGLSGLDLIEKISTLDKKLEFIVLSGYSDFNFAKQAMRHGVKHYLLKPCNENQIIEVMKEAIHDINRSKKLLLIEQEKEQLAIQLTHSLIKNNIVELLFSRLDGLVENILTHHTPTDEASSSSELYMLFHEIQDLELAKSLSANLITKISTKLHLLDQMELTYFLHELYEADNLTRIYRLTSHQIDTIIHYQACSKYKGFIEKILSYVDEHIDDTDLSLKGIAENYLYMNVDYISKQFVKQTGDKFSTYVTRKRIEKAKKLLLQSGVEKIYIVAEQVGCGNNPQYFSQIFKKYTGMTPSSFLKQHSALN